MFWWISTCLLQEVISEDRFAWENLAQFELFFICLGGFPETSIVMSSPEVRELRTQNSQGFEKDNVASINGSSGHGLAKKKPAANKAKVKQAKSRTDIWWLNLRYVLVCARQFFLFTYFSVAYP